MGISWNVSRPQKSVMGNAYVGKVKIGKTGAKRWQFNDNRELFLSILPASIVQKQNCRMF